MAGILSEVLTVIELSAKVWTSFSDAKSRIHDAFDVISRSQAQFELYKPQVEKYLDKKKLPINYKLFTEMMTSFKTKVQRLIELMDKYRGGTVGDKVVFFVKYRSEMEEIVKTLNRYREEFIGFVADMEQYNKTNAAPQQAQVDAEKMREKEKEKEKEVVKQKQNQKSNGSPPADAESQVEELKRLREQNLLYRIMLEKRTELVSAAQADNPNEWQKIEQSLVGMDDKITKDDAKRILAPLKEEIKKIAQDEATAAAKPKMEKAQKMKHVFRVVFVDFDNGARSTLAQAHLEHLRLWIANTTGHWLTNRIESYGAGLDSSFLSSAITANAIADLRNGPSKLGGTPLDVAALAVWQASVVGGSGGSREVNVIGERMRSLKRMSLSKQTLLGARHVVCFGEYTHRLVLRLRGFALSQEFASSTTVGSKVEDSKNGQITLLPSKFLGCNPSTADLEAALANVRTQVQGFLAKEFNWSFPSVRLWDGMYRSRQFLVPQSKRDEVEGAREEICKRNECKYMKVYYAAQGGEVLVTIVGSMDKEKLLQAERDVRALL